MKKIFLRLYRFLRITIRITLLILDIIIVKRLDLDTSITYKSNSFLDVLRL